MCVRAHLNSKTQNIRIKIHEHIHTRTHDPHPFQRARDDENNSDDDDGDGDSDDNNEGTSDVLKDKRRKKFAHRKIRNGPDQPKIALCIRVCAHTVSLRD